MIRNNVKRGYTERAKKQVIIKAFVCKERERLT